MRGLLERGGGLNSKGRFHESSAILISNRAQIPGVPFRLSGNIKEFKKKRKDGGNNAQCFYTIMWCYHMKNKEQASNICREVASP